MLQHKNQDIHKREICGFKIEALTRLTKVLGCGSKTTLHLTIIQFLDAIALTPVGEWVSE